MKYIHIFLLFFLSLCSLQTEAGQFKGQIKSIGVGKHYDAYCANSTACVVVMVDSTYNKTSCNTDSWTFAFDSSTETGKNTLAMVMAAKASGQEVVIGGTGTCTVKSTSEDLNYFYLAF